MRLANPHARPIAWVPLALGGWVVACGSAGNAGSPGDSSTGPGEPTSTTVASSIGTSTGDAPDTTTGGTVEPTTTTSETSADGTSTGSGESTGEGTTGADESTSTGEPACATPEPLVPDDLCTAEEALQAYQPGMLAHGELGTFDVVLVEAEPAPPAEDFNIWTVLVRDVATCTPQPGLTIDVVPFMPAHGHGSVTTPIVTDHGDGSYGVEDLNLWMAGHWRVGFIMTSERLGDDQAAFHLCID